MPSRNPWPAKSARRASLPREYFRNREIVLRRDGHQCQIRTPGLCIGVANQSDHRDGYSRNDHRPEAMRAACAPCHAHRSAGQGGAAAGEAYRAREARRKRRPEPHPGLR